MKPIHGEEGDLLFIPNGLYVKMERDELKKLHRDYKILTSARYNNVKICILRESLETWETSAWLPIGEPYD